jgi:Tfp pilus assembly protein PilN
MAQQINLYDATLRPRRERWRAVHGLWAVGGVIVFAFALSTGMKALAARRLAQAEQLEQQLAAERAQLDRLTRGAGAGGSLGARIAELDKLRALDAGQRRVKTALDAQTDSRRAGYTPYFEALSHQANPSLWITGLSVSADGEGLEIQGRMTDASALPGYLRRLDQEPQFKGRRFAQLSLKSAEAKDGGAADAGFTEFVLRSQPPAEGAR